MLKAPLLLVALSSCAVLSAADGIADWVRDPMLNLGEVKPYEAKAFLIRELVLSEPMAAQELDRYTSWMPGQATSYYYGLMKLQTLRARTEVMLGGNFDQLAYHDFILAQGLLPLELLEKSVLEEFVPASRTKSK